MARSGSVLCLTVTGLAGLTAGCAQLAGIDQTTGTTPDGPAPAVSLAFQRESIGASLVFAPQDLTGFSATYLVTDETDPSGFRRLEASHSAIDTWSADVADGTPPVLFHLPDFPVPLTRLWQLPARTLLGVFAILEHPNPEPAPANATLTVDVTLDTPYAGESFQTYTLGSWTIRGFAATELPAAGALHLGPVAYPFASSASVSGRPLEKLTAADAVVILRYAANVLTGVVEAAPFDQTGNDTITGTMTAVPASQSIAAAIDPVAATMRYTAVRPAVTGLAQSWSINAAPGFLVGVNTGPQLNAGTPLATDTMITASYGNPFLARQWSSLMVYSTSESRTFTPAGQPLPATLAAGMYQLVEPAAQMSLALPAGLPVTFSIDGALVLSDGAAITLPATSIEVSFQTDRPVGDVYQLQIFDLVPNAAGTALQYNFDLGTLGTTPTFTIPRDVFVTGKNYVIRAITFQGGFPNLAAGDLRTRTLPISVAYSDSAVFTVNP